MRLLDGDALEKAIYEWMPKDQEKWMDSKIPPIENLVVSIMMTIQEQQPVDAEPVRHGRWIRDEFGTRCGACGLYAYRDMFDDQPWESPYCPNCGAKMDREQEKQDEE